MKIEPPLYLASRSPRRRQLLIEAGFHPIVIDTWFDDSRLAPDAAASPEQWVQSLALRKAEAAKSILEQRRSDRGVILAADTVCVINSQVEGQPRDRIDARRMLRALRNREHSTISGVAILTLAEPSSVIFVDSALVRVGELGDEMIEGYLDSGDWQGKAGAYNLVERQAAGWPIVCEGDPGTVMGLPMQQLIPILAPLRNVP